MIAILDCNVSNLRSVSNVLDLLQFKSKIIKPNELDKNFSHLIIPGIGNYSRVIETLNINEGKEKIFQFFNTGKPIIGICLGMHLLSTTGEEGGVLSKGLGLIKGNVRRIKVSNKKLLPHIGWNSVNFKKKHIILSNIKDDMDFYFVHSYIFDLDDEKDSLGKTLYEENFNSIICKNNVIGCQFHPEKSQKFGINILKNFCNWNP